MDNAFARIMFILIALTGFAFGFITGAILAKEGYIQFNTKQHSNVGAKQDRYTYSSIEELLEANP